LKSVQTISVIHILWLWHNLWLSSSRNDNKKGENTFDLYKEIIIINELSADLQPH
jgi:hypothetical protein